MSAIYLDHAATTPIAPEVREAMEPWLGAAFGNPSSVHRMGVAAREALDRARAQVAHALGAKPAEVHFTSGGTEANNLAILGAARAAGAGRVVIGPTEHPSSREAALALRDEGFEVTSARLDAHGDLDLEHLDSLLDERVVLVTQMLVCNHFGTVYPLPEVARRVRARAPRACLHVDAVQAVGKLDVRVAELDADTLALSGHKLGAPKGAGALFVRAGRALRPLFFGGGQEAGLRSGTEGVASLVGLGLAVERACAAQVETHARLETLRAPLASALRAAGLEPFEPGTTRQPGILCARAPGAPAEVWLHHLDARGVCLSTGSACQARKSEVSPAFLAAGLDHHAARQLLRLSLSPTTSDEEVARAGQALAAVAAELAAL